MKLIDKSALVAEIERMFDKHSSKHDIDEAGVVLLQLLENVENLEAKEVDLEKEIGIFLGDADWKEGAFEDEQKDMINFAKHFFELGLKTQKGKKV